MPQDPMMPAAPGALATPEPAAGPVKTVCIEMAADGSFKVGLEPKEPAAMPGMGETESPDMEASEEAAMKPAASIDEALNIARQLLSGDNRSPEEAIMAGYNSGPKKPMMMGKRATPGQVFGEE